VAEKTTGHVDRGKPGSTAWMIDTGLSSFHNTESPEHLGGRPVKQRWGAKPTNFTGILGQGTSLTGELNFSGTLRIDGNVHGTIKTADVLIVGETAVIHADIQAGEVRIHGSVFGKIEGKRRIDIFSTGRLSGDVKTPRLVIEEGGIFEGLSERLSELKEVESLQEPQGQEEPPQRKASSRH
jgi:cytoskeletal protein CcmA (bactofilin family)